MAVPSSLGLLELNSIILFIPEILTMPKESGSNISPTTDLMVQLDFLNQTLEFADKKL
jgi:hypothetical protein